MLKQYSNIKELIRAIEILFQRGKIIDGWREGKYWVSVVKGEFISFRVRCLYPE